MDVVFAVVWVVIVDHKLHIVHIQASKNLPNWISDGKVHQMYEIVDDRKIHLAATSVATRIAVFPVLNSFRTHSLVNICIFIKHSSYFFTP